MAEQQQKDDKDTADDPKARASRGGSPPEASERFSVSDLVSRSTGFLGHPSHVVAAALHGQDDDITLDDARSRVERWLNEPVAKEA